MIFHFKSPILSPLYPQVKVTVTLRLPSTYDDLFQLSGELLSLGAVDNNSLEEGPNIVLARARRTHMPLAQVGDMPYPGQCIPSPLN